MGLDQSLNRTWSRRESLIVLSSIPIAPGKLNSIINTQQKLHQTCSISETATEFYLLLYEKQEVGVLGLLAVVHQKSTTTAYAHITLALNTGLHFCHCRLANFGLGCTPVVAQVRYNLRQMYF